MFVRIVRRIAESIFLAVLVTVSVPLLVLRSLRARRAALPAQPRSPHQFAFYSALPAYESVIDAAAAAANSSATGRR